MATPRFVGGPVAQPMDDAQPSGPLSNPWVKYGLIAIGALVALHFLRGGSSGGTRTAPAVTTVPDTNNMSTLGNLSNAITQDYAQNQKFQQDFLTWLHNQNGGGSLPVDGGQIPIDRPGPPSSPPAGTPVVTPVPSQEFLRQQIAGEGNPGVPLFSQPSTGVFSGVYATFGSPVTPVGSVTPGDYAARQQTNDYSSLWQKITYNGQQLFAWLPDLVRG